MPRTAVRPTVAVAIIGLLCVNSVIQQKITAMRDDPHLHYGPSFKWIENIRKVDPTAVTIIVVAGLVGGLGGLAADILWMKSDEYWHSGRVDRMIPVLRTVTLLDPHFIDAWRIAGWHWAYNLYVETKDLEEKDMCLNNGIRFLKEGIVWNPEKFDLYFELGWTYYDKMGSFLDAVEYFAQARTKKDAPRNPDYIQRMIGHAYERIPDIPKALDAYGVVLAEEPGKILGSLDPKFRVDLDQRRITPELRNAIAKTRLEVTPNAFILPEPQHKIWVVVNRGSSKYEVKSGFVVKDEKEKLNVYPGDITGIGATTTIQVKYVPSWDCYARGDYPGAEAAIRDYLATDPPDVIGNHFLARIFEKSGRMDKALEVWEWMHKHNSSDKLAMVRVRSLHREMNRN